MKRVFIILASLALSILASAQFKTGGSYEHLYDSDVISSLRQHVRTLSASSLEGRGAGTEGEKEAAAYIYSVLKGYGVDMLCPEEGDVFGINLQDGDTLRTRNVYGYVKGYDKDLKDRYIVIGARMDNIPPTGIVVDGVEKQQIYPGANGNASGMAMMLELARMVSTNSILFRRSVIFVGFGASQHMFAGSYYFLNGEFSKEADRIDAMINLDMLGTGNEGFYAFTSSNTDLNSIISALKGELQPILPELTSQEPYPSDHRSFYAAEIPSVFFTSGRYAQHNTPKDTESIIDYESMERELEYIYNFTVSTSNRGADISFRSVDEPRKVKVQGAVPYHETDWKPAFQNSQDIRQFMRLWVYQYLKYPKAAAEQGIQGTVQVNFVIEKDGKVSNVSVVKGVHELLDEEAVKVIAASPKWKPGRVDGDKVRTSLTIPVEFRLEKKAGKKSGGFGINGISIGKKK